MAVLGSGISGVLFIQLARALGAGPIIATDIDEHRLTESRDGFGADAALPADGDVVAELKKANDGRLAERVLICTAARPAVEQALQMVDDGGSVLFFAPLMPGETFPVPANDLWKRGISLVHSYAGPPAEMREAIELLAARRVDVEGMITDRLPLAETQRGFALMEQAAESLKVIIEPQR